MPPPLARRLDRLEAAAKPAGRVLPNIVVVEYGERQEAALARVCTAVGITPRPGHGFLVVPAKVTDATRDEWNAAFKTSQMALVEQANIELNELRRIEQEAGGKLVGPITAAIARREHERNRPNPWRTQA